MEQINQINELIKLLTVLDFGTMVALSLFIIAVSKGVTEFFKIQNGITKLYVTLALVIWFVAMTFIATFTGDLSIVIILKLITTFIIVFLVSSGMYNLTPDDKVVEIDVTDIPDFEDMQVSVMEEAGKVNEDA